MEAGGCHSGASSGGGAGGLRLDDGVDSVGEGADSVDGFRVLGAEFDLSVVGPDGGCPGVLREGPHVGEVGRGEVLIDGEGGAHTFGDGIR